MKLEVGTVYHCETKKDAIDLLEKLHALGYVWRGGGSLLDKKTHLENLDNTYFIIEDCLSVLYIPKKLTKINDIQVTPYKKQPTQEENRVKDITLYDKKIKHLLSTLNITIEDSDIYDDREMLVVPKQTIHDEELIRIFKEIMR